MNEYLALVMSLPTRNSTLRMRVWRALKEVGCGVLRDGVYLLPANASQQDALQALENDIRKSGGFAMTVGIAPRGESQAAEMRKLFDRSGDYGALVRRIAGGKSALTQIGSRRGQTEVRRLEKSLGKLASIDFFAGEAKAQAQSSLADLKTAYQVLYSGSEPRASRRAVRPVDVTRYRKRIWATRRTPWVDRLASAWLIRRFIDRDARFAWIARPSECPKNAVGFDFDGAAFTHIGNRVTFEVLLSSFSLEADPALAAIGAAVHFLDVGGIPVPDAKVLETMLKGAKEKARSDDALLSDSIRVFDLLYSGYRAGEQPAAQT